MTRVTPVAAASIALRDSPPGTLAVPEHLDGPRFPNGYIPIDGRAKRLCEVLADHDQGRVTTPITAGRWWDPQLHVAPLQPALIEQFMSSTDPITLPSSPEHCIGWGPGLTPAADDVVVGMLIGFHATGQPDWAQFLAAACAGSETVPFSRSLIDHAAQGRAVRPLLELVSALAGQTSLPIAVGALHHFGATSGLHLIDGIRRALLATTTSSARPHGGRNTALVGVGSPGGPQ